jgi:hypothetical protein
MAHFLDDYEPVEKRISDFWQRFPQGRILTSIVQLDENIIIMRADIFTDRDDMRPVTADFAQEKRGGSGMTANSWLEICATSAIGRALADLDFAKKGKRPSREEMVKAKGHEKPVGQVNWVSDKDGVFEATAKLDFVELATKATDLETLRKLYQQAVKAKADQMTLDFITQRSDDLKK